VIFIALGLLSPLLIGYCLISLLAPQIGRTLRIFLGAGIGAGLASCCLFVSLALGLPPFTLEVLALIAAIVTLARPRGATPSSNPWTTTDKLLGATFSCALIAAIASFLSTNADAPNGGWDAVAIWNFHARFLATPAWRDAFTTLLLYSHPDYPLLLPAFIARIWRLTGDRTLAAPTITAALFTFATIGALVSSLTALTTRTQGFAAGVLLVGTHYFIAHGASEYADVPVSFFVLATLVCLRLARQIPRLDILAGLTAGFAAWTKNEGWTLIVALALVCIARRELLRRLPAIAAGLAPILAIDLYFKFTLATPNEFAGGRGFPDVMAMISTPARYLTIGQGLFASIAGGNFLLPVAGVAIYWLLTASANHDRASAGMCAGLLAIIFTGYCAALLTSPYRIGWQVDTTLDRLLVQLLPASLFTAFLWRSG